jgi:GTPase SAR1 family protein
MNVTFFTSPISTAAQDFGICDNVPPPHNPAYIDEINQPNWIAIVANTCPIAKTLTFCAIDNQIDLRRDDNTKEKICDALLAYEQTIIFVELKQREYSGWIATGYKQLKSTISYFEKSDESKPFTTKKAYIANKLRPNAEYGKMGIMDQFHRDTGYVLRIKNKIEVE